LCWYLASWTVQHALLSRLCHILPPDWLCAAGSNGPSHSEVSGKIPGAPNHEGVFEKQ